MHDYLIYKHDPFLGPLFYDGTGFTNRRSNAMLLTKREANAIRRSQQLYYSSPLQVVHHLTEIAL